MLVAVKLSRGVLVIGERTITHYSGAAHVTIPIEFVTIPIATFSFAVIPSTHFSRSI